MRSLRFLFIFLLGSSSTLLGLPAQAQINPDQTLGTEASIVTPNVEVRGALADLIEGGAARGPNLFHSFSDFNVLEAERIYFANPAGIESILSRVTGNDLSNIFGTLGVDGTANLFLINPNGIVFGPSVNLDVSGSLYATTAEAVSLGENLYSATVPEQSKLLSVAPNTSFFNYLTTDSGNVVNRGQISGGGNVILAAKSLDLQGQIVAGGHLSLLATDTVQIQDTVETPFITFSGGNLLVQGNQQLDIVALAHPDSGLFSYGDMVLRSAEKVGGDTHYWSGGDFSVEQLDGSEGLLFSPIDPVIRAYGDVNLGAYEGSSLHVIAGGSVEIGDAIIRFPEQGLEGDDFLRESVELSNGIIVGIDGSAQPTIDIRAGVLPSAIGTSSSIGLRGLNPSRDFLSSDSGGTANPSGGNIIVGNIRVIAANGRVLLTNQYQPNMQLPNGTIAVLGNGITSGSIDLRNFSGPSGDVFLDARGSIDIVDSFISTTSLGRVGDVILLAGETITLAGRDRLSSISTAVASQGMGTGGSVFLDAQGNIDIIDSFISTTSLGNVGDVVLSAGETVTLAGINSLASISTNVAEQGMGEGGNIFIDAENFNAFHGTQIQSSLLGQGQGGSIVLNIRENALFTGKPLNGETPNPNLPVARALSRIELGGIGQGGSIYVTAENLTVADGAQLSASTLGTGNGGNVVLQVSENILLQGNTPDGSDNSAILSTVGQGAVGNGGDIYASAQQIEALDGALLAAVTSGEGNAGNIILEINDVARFRGSSAAGISAAVTRTTPGSIGNAGIIEISARQLDVLNGAQLSSSTAGTGNAGNIMLDIRDTATFSGFSSNTPSGQRATVSSASASSLVGGSGKGGEIFINSRNLMVTNGAQIISSVFGQGNGGRIELDIDETLYLGGSNPIDNSPSGIFSAVPSQGSGNGGDINISARNLVLDPGSAIDARHDSLGDSGNISISIDENIRSRDGNFRTSATFGSAGNIDIAADTIIFQGDSDIKTTVDSGLDVGEGTSILIRQGNIVRVFFYRATESDGGNISIDADALVALDDSDILTFTDGGRGGTVNFGQTAFFGENYRTAPRGTDPRELDENNQVDINTSGPLASGDIVVSDASFIENGLADLPDNLINPETLVAVSCISRSENVDGTFTSTGSDRLPQTPTEALPNPYSVGTVQPIPTNTATPAFTTIVEPQSVYRLADGRLVISRDCEG